MGIREHEANRRRQNLDQLEGVTSGTHMPGDTYLVQTCLRLRKVPIGQFTVEDLRIMIGQQEGLMFLVPLALDHLESNPLIEGDYYPGDLLYMVLRAGGEFWQGQPRLRKRLERVVANMTEVPTPLAEALREFCAADARTVRRRYGG